MTAKQRYQGIMTAVPTPLDDQGQVQAAPVRKLVERQLRDGITGILPIGGTGEFISLTPQQRLRMLEVTVEAVNGRVPVVAGVLNPGYAEALAAARDYLKAGADSVMVVTPYYYRPQQAGIVDYFRRLSDALDGDLVLYEIPYRTGVSLLPETVAQIVESTRTVAMKACNPDLSQQVRVVEAVADRISILTGEESVFPLHIAMGAVGGMLAGSNLFPRTWTHILDLVKAGDLAAAKALHARLKPATDALYSEPNPAPLKAAMQLIDCPMGSVITPMLPASAACIERLKQVLPAALELERTCATEYPVPRPVV
ncbi:4-hydroxy-tetrahydrodipicolinate synthase [Variovorax sp. WS11]|nr:4-hydroxy-tetrahydrodipicolinate synthase [Variovorax sp. WS11]PSL84357.1 4-hydroxy-tetrahydrodipicolinate synthase [Variovorax sp. WS11]